jgi:hypothetical protein
MQALVEPIGSPESGDEDDDEVTNGQTALRCGYGLR